MSGETTPRVGGFQRGPPSAVGSSYGSPAGFNHSQSVSGGGSVPRPLRSALNPPSAYATTSHAIRPGGGSMSRSTSRARPPLLSHNTTSGATVRMGTKNKKLGDGEGEEDDVEDRGQALIKERQKERKQIRKAKERERERRLAGNTDDSAPPTGQFDQSFGTQQSRGMSASRSVSRTRIPSLSRTGRQPSEGYFSDTPSGMETPVAQSPRIERRPASIYSSVADEDEEEGGIAPDRASIIDELVQSVVDEEVGAETMTEDEDEDEEDLEEVDDEGVTLKDRQDVSKSIKLHEPY